MEWQDLGFTIGQKEILKNVTGVLEPGRLTGIMGPSGSGKTTLMNVLSGRQRGTGSSRSGGTAQSVRVTGKMSSRGNPRDTAYFQRMVAYVFQDSALPAMETPLDCLNFSAFLRLPASVSTHERQALVKGMLERLKLDQCADVIVGSQTRKGLSGGEQKRTAIGVELISKPKMIFLDEPITGLDSYSAYTLMKSLQALVADGVPVMMTMHQPSSEIFDMLDDLLLLHEGEVCYHGPAESLTGYLDLLGFPCSEGYSPADKAMWVVQNEGPEVVRRVKDTWLQSGFHEELIGKVKRAARRAATSTELEAERANTPGEDEASEPEESSGSSFSSVSGSSVTKKRQATSTKHCCSCSSGNTRHQKGLCTTLSALLARDLRKNRRDILTYINNYVMMMFLTSLAYSGLFWGKGRIDGDGGHCDAGGPEWSPSQCVQGFYAHFKFLGMVGWIIVSATQYFAIGTLQDERSVFLRERAGGYYGAFAFFLSKSVYEVPLVFLEVLVMLLGTYWFVGLQGNFFAILLEFEVLSLTSSSTMYIFSAGCSSPDRAMTFATLPVMAQFAFSGILIPVSVVPPFFRWLKWICPMYYGINILGATEFAYIGRGLAQCRADHYGSAPMPPEGGLCAGWAIRQETMHRFGVYPSEFWWNIAMCGVIFVGFRTLAVVLLWKKSRFVH